MALRSKSTAISLRPVWCADHREIVHRSRMIWIQVQYLPVKPLRLVQPPGLVVPHCLIEGLLNRELGHDAATELTVTIRCSTALCHVTRRRSLKRRVQRFPEIFFAAKPDKLLCHDPPLNTKSVGIFSIPNLLAAA